MSTPAELFRAAAGTDPGRPFLTYYDDASGERVELSYTTFDNWVAKTGNMIVEDLAARPGERFSLLLPTHWQTAIWYVACWTAGVVAAPGADPSRTDHVVTAPESLDRALACPGEKVLVPMRPFGAPAGGALPDGVLDYAAEVPAYPDQFMPFAVVHGDDPALEQDSTVLSGAQVVALAQRAAQDWDLQPGDRVLAVAELGRREGLMAGLLAPMAVGASVVLCRHLDEGAASRRMAAERITKRLPASRKRRPEN
jgi:uncharacterized protein (TIGR03089 family)